MHVLRDAPPHSEVKAVTEIMHGVSIVDPYRWLEEQESPSTREWIRAQTRYSRSYLDSIAIRGRIRERIRELLDVETYDSLQKVGNSYLFRKRVPLQEQPCICLREGLDGEDEVLIDPSWRGSGPYTAVKPLQVSPDGRLLLYEVKEGGERSGTFELFNIQTRQKLPDTLSRGYLRGFAFSPDSKSFYYVHEPLDSKKSHRQAVYKHVLGSDFAKDIETFFAGEGEGVRVHIVSGRQELCLLVTSWTKDTSTDIYLWRFDDREEPVPLVTHAKYFLGPILLDNGRILAITDRSAPNFRIVELRWMEGPELEFREVVPDSGSPIQNWCVVGEKLFVSYFRKLRSEIQIFDLSGRRLGEIPIDDGVTVRLLNGRQDADEILLERESFTTPIQICRHATSGRQIGVWAQRTTPFDSHRFHHARVWFRSKDGTEIPMSLVGVPSVLEKGPHPTIMTAYGGYGIPMTPQFSVLVGFLLERGCLFALPNIRGGSEFGAEWHNAAKRRNRQVAFDDFLSAAEWLIRTGRSEPKKLAIFGGSNSGLLVGSAMTQRPELFRAVLCIAPVLDMLRYHLFDDAQLWEEEFGTSADAADFAALVEYSPYHTVKDKTSYPATFMVSGDNDQKCNPLHARKMTARLQAANTSENPVLLDYSSQRGHSPVLPLTDRVEALTDRLAFLCDQLGLRV